MTYLLAAFDYEAVYIFRIAETVYKYVANTNTTAHGQKKMNKHIKLDVEEVRKFVGDFNKLFKDLEAWSSNDVHIKTWKDHFLKEYPKIFNDSSEKEAEMDIEVATTMETKPTIDREKLRKVEEKLLNKRTNERLTDYEGVMSDPSLTPKAIDDVTRRKILWASLPGELLEGCFHQLKKVYEETLVETKIT